MKKPIPPKKGQRGRPVGSKNKASSSLREGLLAIEFHLVDELAELYRSGELSSGEKLRLLTTLLEYTHPKLKEVELQQIEPREPETSSILPPKELLLKAVSGDP